MTPFANDSNHSPQTYWSIPQIHPIPGPTTDAVFNTTGTQLIYSWCKMTLFQSQGSQTP